jgi:hypothetical protein
MVISGSQQPLIDLTFHPRSVNYYLGTPVAPSVLSFLNLNLHHNHTNSRLQFSTRPCEFWRHSHFNWQGTPDRFGAQSDFLDRFCLDIAP